MVFFNFFEILPGAGLYIDYGVTPQLRGSTVGSYYAKIRPKNSKIPKFKFQNDRIFVF
jgi:hypothetical protein